MDSLTKAQDTDHRITEITPQMAEECKHLANTAALRIPDAGPGSGFAIGDQLPQELNAGGRKGCR